MQHSDVVCTFVVVVVVVFKKKKKGVCTLVIHVLYYFFLFAILNVKMLSDLSNFQYCFKNPWLTMFSDVPFGRQKDAQKFETLDFVTNNHLYLYNI